MRGAGAIYQGTLATTDWIADRWIAYRLRNFPKRMFLIGPIGAGKGTHGPRLARIFGIPIFSTGDFFRTPGIFQKLSHLLTPQDESNMKNGGFVTSETVNAIVGNELRKAQYHNGYILDGWPRLMDQFWVAVRENRFDVVLYLSMPCEDSLTRAALRIAEAKAANKKPREDDLKAEKRVKEYLANTQPIVDSLKGAAYLITINTVAPAISLPKEISIRYVFYFRVIPALIQWLKLQKPEPLPAFHPDLTPLTIPFSAHKPPHRNGTFA